MRNYLKAKKIIIILLVISLTISNLSFITSASLNLESNSVEIGRVIEIIDGEVIKVWFFQNDSVEPDIRIIKMIGINTNGSQEAYEYTLNNLLGSVIYLDYDLNDESFPKIEGFQYAYVYKDFDKTFSEELLLRGYASVDNSFIKAKQYMKYLEAEKYSGTNIDTGSIYYSNVININTAPSSLLSEHLEDVTSTDASNIINYRTYNPINTPEEIKFVSSKFDKEWFEKNKDLFNVTTNLNYASIYELKSLFPSYSNSSTLAQEIEDYRLFNVITDIEDIKELTGMSSYYSNFEKYITTNNTPKSYIDENLKVVNLNTSTVSEFTTATNLSSYTGNNIINLRDNNKYVFKSIGELEKYSNPLSFSNSYMFRDNVTVYTDINNANKFELQSLFGIYDITDIVKEHLADKIIRHRPYNDKEELKTLIGIYYNKIEPYIYASESELNSIEDDAININTADKDYAINYLNMNLIDANTYKNHSSKYYSRNNINFNYDNYIGKFTLYTNINTATYNELIMLHEDMTVSLVSDILALRNEEVITSISELSDIFESHDKTSILNEVDDFIVFY